MHLAIVASPAKSSQSAGMHHDEMHRWQHDHTFGLSEQQGAERRTLRVAGLTVVTMFAELFAGAAFDSMALIADGWHMASHAAALLAATFAYSFARRRAGDPRYTFGTGKVSALAGFGSGTALAIVALMVFVESVERLFVPASVHYREAALVAGIGLFVNLLSAWLLRGPRDNGHAHHHGHAHGHQHGHAHQHAHHEDHNLRGAYLHVLADALTSVLAIVALLAGWRFGWIWMDAVVGMIGGTLVAHWSLGLLRDTSRVLLDAEVTLQHRSEVLQALEGEGDDRVCDLHLWRVGPKHLAAIVSIVTHHPRDPQHYKNRLRHFADLEHITVEVHACSDDSYHEHRSGDAAPFASASTSA